MNAWIPVAQELPPNGMKVLVHYVNSNGCGRTVCAEWIKAKSKECNVQFDDFGEYDDAADVYYWPEGWYERIDNWDELTHVVIHEGQPTHWARLPEPPENNT